MCGRTRCTLRPDDVLRASHLNGRCLRHVDMDRYRPSYNVSPGFNLPVIRREDGQGEDGLGQVQGQEAEQGVVLQCMKWGLIPSFTKKTEKPDHYKMFNAQSESIREKVSFRRLVPANRCLVAVEGFFEWKKDGSKRQPYYIHFKDGRPMVFAALFDSWKNSEGEILYTFTVITTSSSSSLTWLHDRMPVILGNKESIEMWLNASSSSNLDAVLKPYGDTDLAWYPVTPAMGKPSFDGPQCIKELKINQSRPISLFFSKKGPGKQLDSKPHGRITEEEATEIHPTKMGENVTEDPENSSPPTDKDDSKPGVSEACDKEAINITTKREYEELSGDTKHSDVEANEQRSSPLQKRLKDERGETVVHRNEEMKKPSPDRINKLGKSSTKKKASDAKDKQLTLLSYFGKG